MGHGSVFGVERSGPETLCFAPSIDRTWEDVHEQTQAVVIWLLLELLGEQTVLDVHLTVLSLHIVLQLIIVRSLRDVCSKCDVTTCGCVVVALLGVVQLVDSRSDHDRLGDCWKCSGLKTRASWHDMLLQNQRVAERRIQVGCVGCSVCNTAVFLILCLVLALSRQH